MTSIPTRWWHPNYRSVRPRLGEAERIQQDRFRPAPFFEHAGGGTLSELDQPLLKAPVSTAVYGLLRIGEVTSSHVKEQPSRKDPVHDPAQHTSWRHVRFYRGGAGGLPLRERLERGERADCLLYTSPSPRDS